ncbi:NUDIX hydrolase [Alkanindiges illinoisensis]|uniref:NUDIX hydrolase n=1 Tax=Alkanindiges illinoisensis TaxID=197183 RepID=UPI000686F810|nr:NUDIX domain-containing protein [Alkanindiges illinoisensis]
MINKACPVLLRQRHDAKIKYLEILAFRHPLAGLQLVKETIEPGELPTQAALRELREEAGIQASVINHLGNQTIAATGQLWHFYGCNTSDALPDQWQFFTQDDGGHWFEFFWHPLVINNSQQIDWLANESETVLEDWHPMFQQALLYLQQRLTVMSSDELVRILSSIRPC